MDSVAEIVTAAGAGPLAFMALLVLVLGYIAWRWFTKESGSIKLFVFGVIVILASLIAIPVFGLFGTSGAESTGTDAPAEQPVISPENQRYTSGADNLIVTDEMLSGEPDQEIPLGPRSNLVGPTDRYCAPVQFRTINASQENVILSAGPVDSGLIADVALNPGERHASVISEPDIYVIFDNHKRFYFFFSVSDCNKAKDQ